MKLAIMQPYFFPYIGYFQLINAVDRFVVYDDVNYIKRGWINRNRILLGGKDHMFTIPVINASQNRLINEILVDQDLRWREKLLKTLLHAYKEAPHFEAVYPLIEGVILTQSETIAQYATESIMAVKDYLNLKTTVIPSSRIYNNTKLKGPDRILDICKAEKADTYINPSGGRELYDKSAFQNNDIDLYYLDPCEHSYDQRIKGDFFSNLSMIDVMMFNSKESIHILLDSIRLS